jgi:MmyB-like transcription regulator ligand binding domain
MRLALHPDGLAPRILNLGEWRTHLLHRLERQSALSADAELGELLEELRDYPGSVEVPDRAPDGTEIMVELRLASGDGELAFFSTVTTFGTAFDVTLSELSIEAFFPADQQTAEALVALAAAGV